MDPQPTVIRVASDQKRDALMIALVLGLIISYIWLWQRAFAGSTGLFSAVLIAVLVAGHFDRGESIRGVGFRLDTAPQAARLLTPIVAAIVASLLLIGHELGSARFPSPSAASASIAQAVAFGLAQQYVLLGVFFRRLQAAFPGAWAPLVAAATLFAACHLPNPFLTVVTFAAGVIAAAVYRRAPNLWVIGIAHGLLSFTLYYSLPFEITGGLRVGPGYWSR